MTVLCSAGHQRADKVLVQVASPRRAPPCERAGGEGVRDTIAMDEFEELVEAVIDHRRPEGSTSLRELDFKIRWLGKGPAEDTWHQYTEMTRKGGLAAFWDYVKAHPELKIKVKT